jgi:hypothetical protein
MAHKRGSSRARAQSAAAERLREDIIEEDRLRRLVERYDEASRNAPQFWDWLEKQRLTWNRSTEHTNRRLAALGLPPIPLHDSLEESRQKLQRLEAQNTAAIATVTRSKAKSGRKHGGTAMASTPPRRHVKEGR